MDLPIVVIGANCAVLGAAAVSEDGVPAYCAHARPGAETTIWSLQPERLRSDQAISRRLITAESTGPGTRIPTRSRCRPASAAPTARS